MSKIKREILNQDELLAFVRYDPVSGKAYWKERDAKWFKDGKKTALENCNWWNKRFAGKEINSLNSKGYFCCCIEYKSYLLHRVIWFYMTGEWPNQIDHINGIRTDNRWCNLREVSPAENNKNQKLRTDNKSKQVGVFWFKQHQKWGANIRINKKLKYLGIFDEFEDAVAVRKAAEIKYGFHENHGRKE